MEAAGVRMAGAPIAHYADAPTSPGDESMTVHAAFPITGEAPEGRGFEVAVLPAVEHAATLLHHGHMDDAFRTGQTIANWIDDNGYRALGNGYAREIYLDCPPGEYDRWVTELQVEVLERAAG
jgi:effector-binding domain-containing protein